MTQVPRRILSLLLLFVAFLPGLTFAQEHPTEDKKAAAEASAIPVEVSDPGLGGTSWQLVKFAGGDGKVLAAKDKAKYQVAFSPDGGVSVRIDCNRGQGVWKSPQPGQLQFGPLALTRAMCPQAPLTNRLAKDWANMSSYVLRDGHLFIALVAGGGTYEFEPAQ
jgi:para-nitrobenzyl esterase